MDTKFSGWLEDTAAPSLAATASHRFVRDLAADSLPLDVFRSWAVQGRGVHDRVIGLFGAAISTAPSLSDRITLTRVLAEFVPAEEAWFARAADALGIPAQDRDAPSLRRATTAFRTALTDAGRDHRHGVTMAALLAVFVARATWGAAADRADGSPFWLAERIELQTGPMATNLMEWLRGRLDHVGPELNEREQAQVAVTFSRIVELERALFDSAYF